MLRLYDLAGADPSRRFSPYCWRIRLALAHKGLEVETVPWRFTDKAAIAPSGQGKVPVLVDGDRWLCESWTIASYLEDAYPDRPSLFGGGAGRALVRFHSAVADSLGGPMLPFLARDIFDRLAEADRDYFRQSREARFGTTLEAFTEGREARLAGFRAGLAPLRATLSDQPFFAGEAPNYADYALFGHFQWARAVSPFQLLAADDPVAAWRKRMLDLFGGLARRSPGY
ncbi:MAG TPA: glutathione S-transferase family protein, partial [Caulobacteraceae bacterium]|nr:glutathione S-transferase family protein [Caulobacteraceae bacterium]